MPYADPEIRREYTRGHYRRNKAAYKARAVSAKRETTREVHAWILSYLRDHQCKDCGEPDPVVLEFDHRNGVDKRFAIGDACHGGFSLKNVIAEVQKCDVRCANCHRRATYLRANRKHRG